MNNFYYHLLKFSDTEHGKPTETWEHTLILIRILLRYIYYIERKYSIRNK